MKITTIIILLFYLNVFSQEKEISELENLKFELIGKINKLNDSLKKIDKQINFIKSRDIKNLATDSLLTTTARKDAYIKKTPDVLGEIISKLDESKKIVIMDYIDGYFGICTDSICGYMSEMWIQKNDKIYDFIKVKNKEQEEIKRLEKQNDLKAKKAEYAKLEKELEKEYIKKYGQKTYDKLKEGYYWIGMNREMATISLGRPKDINRTVGFWGVHEQWVYDDIYLYFENGKLTSYQN